MSRVDELLALARKERHGYPKSFVPEAPDYVMTRFARQVPPQTAKDAFQRCHAVTMMSGEDYRNFIVDDEYLTFWQTGPTWHSNYSPEPEKARLFNDQRLFGEKADTTAYGVVLCDAPTYEISYANSRQLQEYLSSYLRGRAGKLIEWRDAKLEECSFTYGDSAQNILAFKFSPARLMAYICAVKFTEWLFNPTPQCPPMFLGIRSDLFKRVPPQDAVQSCAVAFLGTPGVPRNPYFELHFHDSLTPDDIKRIL